MKFLNEIDGANRVKEDSEHQFMTATEKTKLAGIAAGAEVNVNTDWNAVSGDAQLLNKPTLGALAAKDTIGTNDITDAAVTVAKLANLAAYSLLGRNAASAGAPAEVSMLDAVEYGLFQGTTATSIADTEYVSIPVSATSLKKITWANVKVLLDTIYAKKSAANTFTNTTDSTSTITGSMILSGGLGVAKSIYADKVMGADWNDYAEYRVAARSLEPGTVVEEIEGDKVDISTGKNRASMVITDTFGFALGAGANKVPIAVAGRVLVKVKNRDKLRSGDMVCAGANGLARKMGLLKRIFDPHAALGIVLSVPNYTEWGEHKIQVNNRVWIKVI